MSGHPSRVVAPDVQRYTDRLESPSEASRLVSRIALGSVGQDEAILIVRGLVALRHGPQRTCKRGHPWTPENRKPKGEGATCCRVCERETNRQMRQRVGKKKRCTICGRVRGYLKSDGPCPDCRGGRRKPGPKPRVGVAA